MGEVSTIGLDIAKSVFQVHGVDDSGAVVIRKRVSRAKVLAFFGGLRRCLVGIEACPSAHYWSRKLQALGHGAADAAELCESLSQTQQERRQRCGSNLRGGDAALDAVCTNQDEGATDWPDAAPEPAIAGTSTHDAVECNPRAHGRARHHLGQGP